MELFRNPFSSLQITPVQQKGLFFFALLMVFFIGVRYGISLDNPGPRINVLGSDQTIVIELQGEVHRPGLYMYAQQPTLHQVIRDGGGFIFNDSSYKPEKAEGLPEDASLTIQYEEGKVLIRKDLLSLKGLWILGRPIPLNRASAEDLDRLPGIGPGLARRIIEFREIRGKFSSLDELKEVKGIKEKTFEKIKGYLIL
jgi:competence protein ComEA